MEIALGGIIILVILLPGISFRKGYFSEEFSNQYTIRDFFNLFVNTLFPSLIIYLIALPVIYYFFDGYYYDFKTLLGILSSNDKLVENSVNQIGKFKYEIIFFQSIINLISFGVGLRLRDIILRYSFDAENKFFRYKNIWHYLLTGKFILFGRSQIKLNKDTIRDIDITYINSLVQVGEYVFNYTGILVDYELSDNGNLDLLYIKDSQRKPVDELEYKDINGHTLILKYENIINLNLVFIQTEEDEKGNISLRMIE
jgi:hypothetical protein